MASPQLVGILSLLSLLSSSSAAAVSQAASSAGGYAYATSGGSGDCDHQVRYDVPSLPPVNGNFWWAAPDSPFKAAYEYFKKCTETGKCVPTVPALPSPGHDIFSPIDISKNPFLNGNFGSNFQGISVGSCSGAACKDGKDHTVITTCDGKQCNTQQVDESQKIDISGNPFLSGTFGSFAGGSFEGKPSGADFQSVSLSSCQGSACKDGNKAVITTCKGKDCETKEVKNGNAILANNPFLNGNVISGGSFSQASSSGLGCTSNTCGGGVEIGGFHGSACNGKECGLEGNLQSVAVSSCSGSACKDGKDKTVVTTCTGKNCKTEQTEGTPNIDVAENPFLNGQFTNIISGSYPQISAPPGPSCKGKECNANVGGNLQSVAVSSCSGIACKDNQDKTVITTCNGKDCKTEQIAGASSIDVAGNPFLNGQFANKVSGSFAQTSAPSGPACVGKQCNDNVGGNLQSVSVSSCSGIACKENQDKTVITTCNGKDCKTEQIAGASSIDVAGNPFLNGQFANKISGSFAQTSAPSGPACVGKQCNGNVGGNLQSVAVSSCSGIACEDGKDKTVITTCNGKDCKTEEIKGSQNIDIAGNPFLNGQFVNSFSGSYSQASAPSGPSCKGKECNGAVSCVGDECNINLGGNLQSVAVSSCSGIACKDSKDKTVITTCNGKDCSTKQLEGANKVNIPGNQFLPGQFGSSVSGSFSQSGGCSSATGCGITSSPALNLIPASLPGQKVVPQSAISSSGVTVTTGADGFLGVQPAPPFGKTPKPFPTTYPGKAGGSATITVGANLPNNPLSLEEVETARRAECKGIGYLCVAKDVCVNGVTKSSIRDTIQVKNDIQYCKPDVEVCCKLLESSATVSAISSSSSDEKSSTPPSGPSDLSSFVRNKESLPASKLSYSGGVGLSPGSIVIVSENETPEQPSNQIPSSVTNRPVPKNVSPASNIISSEAVDVNIKKFSTVPFPSTIQGHAYLPPKPSPTPDTFSPDLEAPGVPTISTYKPPLLKVPTTKPFETSSPRPFSPPASQSESTPSASIPTYSEIYSIKLESPRPQQPIPTSKPQQPPKYSEKVQPAPSTSQPSLQLQFTKVPGQTQYQVPTAVQPQIRPTPQSPYPSKQTPVPDKTHPERAYLPPEERKEVKLVTPPTSTGQYSSQTPGHNLPGLQSPGSSPQPSSSLPGTQSLNFQTQGSTPQYPSTQTSNSIPQRPISQSPKLTSQKTPESPSFQIPVKVYQQQPDYQTPTSQTPGSSLQPPDQTPASELQQPTFKVPGLPSSKPGPQTPTSQPQQPSQQTSGSSLQQPSRQTLTPQPEQPKYQVPGLTSQKPDQQISSKQSSYEVPQSPSQRPSYNVPGRPQQPGIQQQSGNQFPGSPQQPGVPQQSQPQQPNYQLPESPQQYQAQKPHYQSPGSLQQPQQPQTQQPNYQLPESPEQYQPQKPSYQLSGSPHRPGKPQQPQSQKPNYQSPGTPQNQQSQSQKPNYQSPGTPQPQQSQSQKPTYQSPGSPQQPQPEKPIDQLPGSSQQPRIPQQPQKSQPQKPNYQSPGSPQRPEIPQKPQQPNHQLQESPQYPGIQQTQKPQRQQPEVSQQTQKPNYQSAESPHQPQIPQSQQPNYQLPSTPQQPGTLQQSKQPGVPAGNAPYQPSYHIKTPLDHQLYKSQFDSQLSSNQQIIRPIHQPFKSQRPVHRLSRPYSSKPLHPGFPSQSSQPKQQLENHLTQLNKSNFHLPQQKPQNSAFMSSRGNKGSYASFQPSQQKSQSETLAHFQLHQHQYSTQVQPLTPNIDYYYYNKLKPSVQSTDQTSDQARYVPGTYISVAKQPVTTETPSRIPSVQIVPSQSNNFSVTYDKPIPPTIGEEIYAATLSGCAAALKCVQEIYCTADGFISSTPVVLTREQQTARVPLQDCVDESRIRGKCCRDAFYQDPWPSANLINGVDDGQYREDDSIGQYRPDNAGQYRSTSQDQYSETRQRPGRRISAAAAINEARSLANQNEAFNNPTCGTRNPGSTPQATNPLEAAFAEFPWQAMILRDSTRTLLCGGVIIRPDVVLTTAHCLDGIETRDVLIKGGEWKLGVDEEPLPFKIVAVDAIIRHPNYRPGSLINDLALLILKEKLRLTKNIGTLCLPSAGQIPTNNCVVTGWGKQILQVHLRGAIMRSIPVNILQQDQCESVIRNNHPDWALNYSPNTVCGVSEQDHCAVDYGSALACTNDQGRYTLSGIFSWDTGCNQEDQIGGYVAPDVNWIETTCSKPLPELKSLEAQYLTEIANL